MGKQDKLVLGNLEAKRDWGFAGDYVQAMWKMLQQKNPAEYVIATGKTHSIKEFLQEAFAAVEINEWESKVETSKEFFRPSEVDALCGNASKARKELNWTPKTNLKQLAKMMVDADLEKNKIF